MKAFKNVLRRFHAHSATLAFCCFLFGALHAGPVAAQSVAGTDAAFGRFMSTTVGAGQTSVSFGSNGIPLASPSSATLYTNGSADLANTRTGSITNPSGNPVQVTGVGKYGGAKVGALLTKGLKAVPYIGVGFAIYDAFKEAGLDPQKNADGSINWRKLDPAVCSVSPCYDYYANSIAGGAPSGWKSSAIAACTQAAANYTAIAGGNTGQNPVVVGSTCYVNIHNSSGAFITQVGSTITTASKPPAPANYIPSSEQEYIDAIAIKSGWPASSALARAVVDAAQITGERLLPDAVTVTGPATSTGPAKTVVHSDGSKTVSTPVHNHTYNNNIVTTTTTTTINNYNSSNVLTSTSTETSTPEQQKTDCEKNPAAVGCSQLGDVPSDDVPKSERTVTYTPIDLGFGEGSCPAPIPITTSKGTYQIDLASYCNALTTYVRPAVILVAVFLSFLIVTGTKIGSDD